MRHGLPTLHRPAWPYGALCANFVGAFVNGLVGTRARDERVKAFLVGGMLGGLTTFSTLTLEATSTSARDESALPDSHGDLTRLVCAYVGRRAC